MDGHEPTVLQKCLDVALLKDVQTEGDPANEVVQEILIEQEIALVHSLEQCLSQRDTCSFLLPYAVVKLELRHKIAGLALFIVEFHHLNV